MSAQVVLLLISPSVFYGSFYVVAVFANSIAEPVRCVDFFACIAAAKSYFFFAVWTVDNLVHIIWVAFDVPVVWYVIWLISLLIVVPAVKRCHFWLPFFHHTSRNRFCHSQSSYGVHNQGERCHRRCNLCILWFVCPWDERHCCHRLWRCIHCLSWLSFWCLHVCVDDTASAVWAVG